MITSNELPIYSIERENYDYDLLIKSVKELIDNISSDKSYQSTINGCSNYWIMKPSGLSRGRGIQVHNNINKILSLIIEEKDVYVAQKYIEKPLIVNKRKFDIRQWVLVTDFNPLTIFIYDEFYVRFAL